MNVLAYVHLRNIVRSTGAGRVARQLTEHLSAEPGVDLRVLADAGDHGRVLAEAGTPWTGYQYYLFPLDTSRQQARWYLLRSPAAEAYWSEADITYCTAESFVPTKRSRLAVTVHDAAIFESGAHRVSADLYRQRLKWTLLYRALSRNVDLFHTVSQFSADRLSHFFPEIRSRMHVVPNAVAESFFRPVTEHGLDFLKQNELNNRPYILLPGGLHFRKNAELVFQAWPVLARQHPDLRLVIPNHSDPEYARRAATELPSHIMAGFMDDEQLKALYARAAAVWFPSLYEGFGMPVLEAMACGAPVVASNSTAIPEVSGGIALLAEPNDANGHVERLESLIVGSGVRSWLIERGQEHAATFRWAASARRLRAGFERLM
jgi:glycosyltransferase involved in cell wall biosynthesis